MCGLSHHATPLPKLLAPSTLLLLPKCARLAPTSGPLRSGSPCRQLPPTPAWLHLPSIGSHRSLFSESPPPAPTGSPQQTPTHTAPCVPLQFGSGRVGLLSVCSADSPEPRETPATQKAPGNRSVSRRQWRQADAQAASWLGTPSPGVCRGLFEQQQLVCLQAVPMFDSAQSSLACVCFPALAWGLESCLRGGRKGRQCRVTVGTPFASTPRAWLWPVLTHSSTCPRGWQGCTLAPRHSSHG